MLKTIVLPAVASALISTSALADEHGADANVTIASKAWEIGVTGTANYEGSNNDELGTYPSWGIRGSYRVADHWAVVGQYAYAPEVKPRDGGDKVQIHRFLAEVNYDVAPHERRSPYFIVGAGYETFDNLDDRDGMLVDLGLGLRYALTECIGANIEAKAKANLDHSDQTALLTFALNYRF